MSIKLVGKVTLVGAGPGDPELLTLKAVRAIEAAEVVVHDRLVTPEILDLIPADAERVDVGKRTNHHPVPQDEINALLVGYAKAGRNVVRLKGGDPFIFGRGCEEAAALVAAGVPYAVVPGITAAQGAAASAGVPLTHRGLARSVRYVTGHCRADEPLDLDWAGLADRETTLVVYMGRASIREFAAELMAQGRAGETPVLAVANATTRDERRLASRLATIEADIEAAGLASPIVFIIGEVAGLAETEIIDVAVPAGALVVKEAVYA
ncbi:MAG TPA: uroporphyrinogen-III C-methyltransferase [Kaistiaceae bacterium]|nr:uroporphyrinogen-III C-methyltransferase [Kaistiaceae bacterium]